MIFILVDENSTMDTIKKKLRETFVRYMICIKTDNLFICQKRRIDTIEGAKKYVKKVEKAIRSVDYEDFDDKNQEDYCFVTYYSCILSGPPLSDAWYLNRRGSEYCLVHHNMYYDNKKLHPAYRIHAKEIVRRRVDSYEHMMDDNHIYF